MATMAMESMDDSGLTLNIVSEPPEAAVSSRKKPRKRNNYEKRRRRAREAKERDGDDKGQPTLPMKRRTSEDNEAKHSSMDPLELSVDGPIESVHDDFSEADCQEPLESEEKTFSSRSQLPEDLEERAKYLAEFHARPLELDRRSGATVRNVAESKDSQHLFQNATEWTDFGLHTRLVGALQTYFNLRKPTMIQSKAIPAFSGNGNHNLLLHSETGSGKTLAYLLPIVHALAVDGNGEQRRVNRGDGGTRCIILCPTRELASQTLALAEQVCLHSFPWLVAGCLFGEEKRKSEKARIRKGISILVATPGRLLDHLTRTESLLMALKAKLEWLVLDEADRLLDMGLGEQVKQIVQRLRANQPGCGRNGVTWRSVLLSATVTPTVEELAKETLQGGDNSWVWVKGGSTTSGNDDLDLTDSTPKHLSHLHLTVSAKLRLPALVAFLAQRAYKGERTVVFMSTCSAVDFYHSLFTALAPIWTEKESGSGVFGSKCSVFRLHGSVAHGERQLILRQFTKSRGGASVLLATDVAARGLNLPDVDWTVQFDPPSEITDYAHRAGRVARAGKGGHSLLFLLPSECGFLDVLKKRGFKNMAALSLAATLNEAAALCKDVTESGLKRAGTNGLVHHHASSSRPGEAFGSELQRRVEECVVKAGNQFQLRDRSPSKKGEGVSLMLLAKMAFLSYIRAYPTKEKAVRHIFTVKALHLGHVARSFALREAPKKLGAKRSTPDASTKHTDKKRTRDMAFKPFDGVADSGKAPRGKGTNRLAGKQDYYGLDGM